MRIMLLWLATSKPQSLKTRLFRDKPIRGFDAILYKDIGAINTLQQAFVHIATREIINCTIRRDGIDIRHHDISANTRAATNNISR